MAKRSAAGTGADQARGHSDLSKRTSSPELTGCSASRAAATLQFSGFPLERPTGQAAGCGSRCTQIDAHDADALEALRMQALGVVPADPRDGGTFYLVSSRWMMISGDRVRVRALVVAAAQ
ncbi:hypothetical protein ACH4MT_32490 [Streptomyces anulatus]